MNKKVKIVLHIILGIALLLVVIGVFMVAETISRGLIESGVILFWGLVLYLFIYFVIEERI